MMSVVFVLLAKGAFSDVIEGANPKNFRSLHSRVEDLPFTGLMSLTYGL